jgi:hypothetical protein
MRERPSFVRTWLLLFAIHAALTAIVAAVSKAGLPGWLRDPLGIFSVFTLYGPIALVSRLGVPRAWFERAAWLFGDITPAGWGLVVVAWLGVHAVLALAIVKVRRGSD